ncbi:MAG: hypothetical protein AAB554_05690 [Patescibacteria group bacterium]
MAQKKLYPITAGPTKEDLLAGPFTKDGDARTVNFTMTSPSQTGSWSVDALLAEVTPEDGSGQSWCFAGFIKGFRPDRTAEKLVKIRGYYDSRSKKGWIVYL